MKYNRKQATASWGTMAKDWEKGIDYDRLHKERVKRAQAAIRHAGLGAVLAFNFDNIRYITGTHIGEWARDKFMRYALCPVVGEPMLWDPAPPAKRISSPWIADNVAAPISTMQGGLAAAAQHPGRLRQADQESADEARHRQGADRHRSDGTADAPRAGEGRHRGGRRPAGHARRPRSQDRPTRSSF